MKIENITNEYLRRIAENIDRQCQGLGFALILFEHNKKSLCRYISNSKRKDMIKALRESADKIKLEMELKNGD